MLNFGRRYTIVLVFGALNFLDPGVLPLEARVKSLLETRRVQPYRYGCLIALEGLLKAHGIDVPDNGGIFSPTLRRHSLERWVAALKTRLSAVHDGAVIKFLRVDRTGAKLSASSKILRDQILQWVMGGISFDYASPAEVRSVAATTAIGLLAMKGERAVLVDPQSGGHLNTLPDLRALLNGLIVPDRESGGDRRRRNEIRTSPAALARARAAFTEALSSWARPADQLFVRDSHQPLVFGGHWKNFSMPWDPEWRLYKDVFFVVVVHPANGEAFVFLRTELSPRISPSGRAEAQAEAAELVRNRRDDRRYYQELSRAINARPSMNFSFQGYRP